MDGFIESKISFSNDLNLLQPIVKLLEEFEFGLKIDVEGPEKIVSEIFDSDLGKKASSLTLMVNQKPPNQDFMTMLESKSQ
jgi:hypothetical protein